MADRLGHPLVVRRPGHVHGHGRHPDAELDQVEGLRLAAENLKAAAAAAGV